MKGWGQKSNYYIRGITSKHVKCRGAQLSGLAPGQQSYEETSQRWRAVNDTVPISPARESNPRSLVPIAMS